MQGLKFAAITASEKCTLMPELTKTLSAKSRSRAQGHSVCLKSMSRIITLHGLTLAAITAAEKGTLML